MSRTLALDVGTKTIGVAISDPLGLFAQPVETVRRTGRSADVARLLQLLVERPVATIVVGLPLNGDGSEGPSAQEARRMASAVAAAQPEVAVRLLDERFTTAQAQRSLIAGNVRRMERKALIDQAAAMLILQQWLDRPEGGELVEVPQ